MSSTYLSTSCSARKLVGKQKERSWILAISRFVISHDRSYRLTIPPNQDYLEKVYNRLLIVGFAFSFFLIVIVIRLLSLVISASPLTGDSLNNQQTSTEPRKGISRSDILDRKGNTLATNVSTISLHAEIKQISNAKEVVEKLEKVLATRMPSGLLNRLNSSRSSTILVRHLTPKQQQEILGLGIPGLKFRSDSRRVYPQGKLTAHVIGFTDIDNNGLSGIERGLNREISMSPTPLILSLDLRTQHIIRDELAKGIVEFQAKGGCAILLDIKTGEVLSMVSVPDFDPNFPMQFEEENLFNKATAGIYEMGSTMKIANTAMALESGLQLAERFDVSHPINIGTFRITDYHTRHEWLSVPEIFLYSSNIGSSKIALEAGSENQYAFLRKLGFLDCLSLEVPEVGLPMAPRQWLVANRITASYGYGLATSPLQLVCGVASIVRGGDLLIPTFLHHDFLTKPIRTNHKIVSGKTSRTMLELMRLAIKVGTARKADVKGYFIFAKTGTVNLRVRKNYQKQEVITNFIGILGKDAFTPMHIIYIMLDQPRRLRRTLGLNVAGLNVAMVGSRVMRKIAPILGYEQWEDEPKIKVR